MLPAMCGWMECMGKTNFDRQCSVIEPPKLTHSHLPPSSPPLQDRMESIRREQEEAELAECSFAPRIDPRSSALVRERQAALKVGRRWGMHVKKWWVWA
jgi:hypothetical protein